MNEQVLGGRYQVLRQLGKQTGRQTFLACDLQTQMQVVIKLLSLGSDFDWQDLKLFEREAKTLQNLTHPAIPRYLDYLELDSPLHKGFALVQSYVEGKTLEDQLKAGRTFTEEEVKELAKSLLEILIYLHDLEPPVIHRDIKPSNILLTNRSGNSVGQVYLVDFGSVQTLAAREGGTITVVGTYGYMPPEQFGGRSTAASDLYSLGATLIYLVTGLHPTELPQKDFRIEFQPIVSLSPEFADWLEWMTEPSLDRRLSSAREALAALNKPRIRKKAALAVKKPRDSEVQLIKTPEFLEIILPPKGFGFGAIAWLSVVIPLLFMSPYMWKIPLKGVSFILVSIIICILLARIIILDMFGRIYIRFDQQKVSFKNELFGIKWRRFKPVLKQDIAKLEILEKFVGYNLETRRNWLPYQLILHADKQQYMLTWKHQLSAQELEWLAHELSNSLEIPLAKK